MASVGARGHTRHTGKTLARVALGIGPDSEARSARERASVVTFCLLRVAVAHKTPHAATQRGITLANSRRNEAEGSELYYAGGIDHVTRKTPRTHAYSYCDAILGT